MKGASKLKFGDLIEIQTNSWMGHESYWEPAVFDRAVNKELPNHYWVKLPRTVWVAYGNVIDEDSVSIYGSEAKQTDMIIVPSRRIRRRKP